MKNFDCVRAGIAIFMFPLSAQRRRAFGRRPAFPELLSIRRFPVTRATKALASCTRALNEEALDAHDRAGTLVNRGILEMMRRQGR